MLIVIGGPPGAGKSTVARRLATDLRVPRLGSDTLGHLIARSEALPGKTTADAWRLA